MTNLAPCLRRASHLRLPNGLGRALPLFIVGAEVAIAASNTWDGGSAIDGNWSSAINWVGDSNVPGSTLASGNTDVATFTGPVGTWGGAIVIDSATQSIGGITFSTAGANLGNYVIGSTDGNALYLTSGGTIQINNSSTTAATYAPAINAPLVVTGTDATYTFVNQRSSNGNNATLVINGGISAGGTGNAVLTFGGQFQQNGNTVNGVISDGDADSVSLRLDLGTGSKWTFSNDNTFTGSVTLVGNPTNTGYTAATFTGGNATTGAVSVNSATLNLGTGAIATGGLASATSYTIYNGALNLTNTAGNADRLANDGELIMRHNSVLNLTHNATTNTSETLGGLTLADGNATFTISSAASRVTSLVAGGIVRNDGATALVRGTSLNQSVGTNVARILFADGGASLDLVGSQTLNNGATNDSAQGLTIVPYLIGATSTSSTGTNFVTYDSTLGLRVLTAAQQTSLTTGYTTAANPDNARAGANVTLTNAGGVTVNSLLFDSASASTLNSANANALTVNSGAVASVVNQSNAIGSGFSQLTLGNGEGVVTITQGTLSIDTPVAVTSSGGLVKAGTGTLVLAANNLYSGSTTVNQGTLQIGNGGGTGNLGVTVAPSTTVNLGATLSYNRTGNYAVSNVSGGGTVRNDSAGTTLTLLQSGSGKTLAVPGGVSGSTIEFAGNGTGVTALVGTLSTAGQLVKVTSGTVNLGSGTSIASNLEVAGGVVSSINGFSMATTAGPQTLAITGGELLVTGSSGVQSLNNTASASSAGVANTFAVNQSGGLFSLTGDSAMRFHMGSTTGGASTTYNLSGGTLSVVHAGNRDLTLGADVGGTSTTTFNLSGGKLISNQNISGSQGTGAKQAFVWTGGTLAALSYNATNLTSTYNVAVGTGTNTLTNAGGTLAPGDIGTPGRTIITGNYSVTSPDASLAIDIGGTTQGNTFQNTPDRYDYVNVAAGAASLGGKLQIGLINGYTPPDNTSTLYNVLASTGTGAGLSGTFTNLMTASGGNQRVVLADGLSSFLVGINTTGSSAHTGGLTSVAARTVALGGYKEVNTYTGAGTDWDTAAAGAWANFDPGATVTPGTQASGAIAQFADGTASTGAINVSLNSTRNLQGIQFASAAGSRAYTLSDGGSGALILDNTGNAAAATIADTSASGTTNAVNVPLTLNSNLAVSVADASNTLTLGGAITGTGKTLTKTGAGILTLSGGNTYTGGTTVSAGTLLVNNLTGSGTGTGALNVASGATLGGSGTIAGTVAVAGTLSPGNSPGLLTTGAQTWSDGGNYNWQVFDATGAAGTGYDSIAITSGGLDLTGLTTGGFNINLWSLSGIGPDVNGDATNFDNSLNQSWTLVSNTGDLTSISGLLFTVNVASNNGTTGFSNNLGGGSFSVVGTEDSLDLIFTAGALIPEPSTYAALAAVAALGFATLRRIRSRNLSL